MVTPAIQLWNLGRTFQTGKDVVVALRDVSLTVPQGQIVGLLGKNGAGKTTLTKILATLLLPTHGTAFVFGYDIVRDVRAARTTTGVVFGGDRGLYGRLTGRENVRFFAMLNGVGRRVAARRVGAVLGDVGLDSVADRAVETYSKGMRQRLHIAIGLVTRPRLLLLDEPTVGLDPLEAERLRLAIGQLKSEGVTILLTSHYLLDIERLADRVLLMSNGSLVADADVPTFARMAGYVATVTVRGRGSTPWMFHRPMRGMALGSLDAEGPLWTAQLRVIDWSAAFADIGYLLASDDVLDFDIAPVRLEDAYAQLEQAAASGTLHA